LLTLAALVAVAAVLYGNTYASHGHPEDERGEHAEDERSEAGAAEGERSSLRRSQRPCRRLCR
jgi:hypothetical protein